MKVVIRPATLVDIDAIIPFIQIAAGDVIEFVLTDEHISLTVKELIEIAIFDENTIYHYKNILVAEYNKIIIAASNFYPAEYHGIPEIISSFVSQEKLKIIEPYFKSIIKNSMYIHTLAVAPEYRHMSCGLLLCKEIESIAKNKNMACLSAHVWCDNTLVYNGLKMIGCEIIEHIPIANNPNLFHQGGMYLLKGPDFINDNGSPV